MAGRFAVAVTLAVACLFTALASVNLLGQGLHGDELHQATAAFAYRSGQLEISRGLTIGGIPVLNMPYSGAIKSALYAAYLALPGTGFSVVSWRLLGIGFSAAGILGFGWLAGRRLDALALVLFLALVASDAMLLLGSRHDWGPIALAFLLRMWLLAVWIRGESETAPAPSNSFWIGVIAGMGLFEKLSNVAVVAILPLLFGLSRKRRNLRHGGAVMIGAGVGALPLGAVNAYTYLRDGELISLSPEMQRSFSTEQGLGGYLLRTLDLGAGREARRFILGGTDAMEFASLEAWMMLSLILVTSAAAALFWRRSELLRNAATLLACYLAVALVIFALPRTTWVHHWVIGTPFQYLAFALALAGLWQLARESGAVRDRAFAQGYTALLLAFLVMRSFTVISLERSLLEGKAAQHWSPSTIRFGELMSEQVAGGLLITAGWGLAPSAYCFSNGAPNFVHDLFWTYQRPSEIKNRLNASNSRALFVAKPEWWTIVDHSRGTKMWRDLDAIESWAPDWREVPVEGELGELEWISVRKFVRDELRRAPETWPRG